MLIISLSDIRSERQTLRVSALELALEARISQGRLSYIERGIVRPHDGELWRIQEALDRIRTRRLAELERPSAKLAEYTVMAARPHCDHAGITS